MDIETQIKEMDFESMTIPLPQTVKCFFKTALPEKYRIEDTLMDFNINIDEKGFNEFVNDLIKKKNRGLCEPLNLEFMVKGVFLRESMKSLITREDINPTHHFKIEYTLALDDGPKFQKIVKTDSWVFSISKCNPKSTEKSSYGIGFFDGSFAMYTPDHKLIGKSSSISKLTMRGLKFINKVDPKNDTKLVITGSSDSKIRVSRITKKSEGFIGVDILATCEGHADSVECIDLNPNNDFRFCSGGFDCALGIWELKEKQFDSILSNESAIVEENPLKRVKLSSVTTEPLWIGRPHEAAITKTIWARDEMIYSASLDGTIKIFDPYQCKEVLTYQHAKEDPVTAMSYKDGLLAIGTDEGGIKLLDEKMDPQKSSPLIKGHLRTVTDVKFHPSDSNMFLSVSHDMSIKIWDIRSSVPRVAIGDLNTHLNAAEWNGAQEFLVGGNEFGVAVYHYDPKESKPLPKI